MGGRRRHATRRTPLALVELSRGGADAAVVREFDMATSANSSTDGFQLPEAKSGIAWKDRDTVLVGTDFGPGSLTDSGYPRIVKRWRRGQPLEDARTPSSRASPTDVRVRRPGTTRRRGSSGLRRPRSPTSTTGRRYCAYAAAS